VRSDSRQLWGELGDRPTFVLTADQDWAPEWAMASTLDLVADAGVPLHLFVTNESNVLASHGRARVSTGIHPNFVSGSSHGNSPEAVVESCLALSPGATTFRSHRLMESSPILQLLVRRGLTADSNLCLYLQPIIVPLLHAVGLLRFPIFLADDVLLARVGPSLHLGELAEHMFTPGLKILSFHPSLVALNAPSMPYLDDRRPALFGGAGELSPYAGRGVRDLLSDLIKLVQAEGYEFEPFLDLVTESRARLVDRFPAGLGGWRPA
jgi:hypothetical protein